MPRTSLVCLTIVAAFCWQPASAATVSEDVPIPGGTAALAAAIGLPAPDRARFVPEIIRAIYETPGGRRHDTESPLLKLLGVLDVVRQFQRAVDAIDPRDGFVSLAGEGESRVRLRAFAEASGLRFREAAGLRQLEMSPVPSERARADLLSALGLDLRSLVDELNAGRRLQVHMPVEYVPVPLTTEIWSRAILRRPVTPAGLVAAILGDAQTALLCHGLAAFDDETLAAVIANPELLERLRLDAPAVAGFASHVRVAGGVVLPPGGAAAAPLWEAVVGAPTVRPERFIPALFAVGDGRLAYLYDLMGDLGPAHRAFALGLWIQDPAVRLERFRMLAAAATTAFEEWSVRQRPFGRPLHDLAELFTQLDPAPDGALRSPAASAFWEYLFDSAELPDGPVPLPALEEGAPVDAAWLVQRVLVGDSLQRAARLTQLSFAFRVFPALAPSSRAEALVALRGVPRYGALMFTLERIGIQSPAVYAAAARRAARLTDVRGDRAFAALAQFQGALALIARMAAVETFDLPRTEALIGGLIDVPLGDDGRYRGAVVRWLRRELLADAPAGEAEAALLRLLAGVPGTRPDSGLVEWEGERYRFDLVTAEQTRLDRVRERQHTQPIDVPLEIERVAAALTDPAVDGPAVERAIAALTALAGGLVVEPWDYVDVASMSVRALPMPRDALSRAVADLAKVTRPRDGRVARVADALRDLADAVMATTLSSLVYAVNLGDPDGIILLGGDVSRRHEFGFDSRAREIQRRTPWLVPRQRVEPGVPWHVRGSLLGLDVALAPLLLRRLSTDGLASAPTLVSNDRETFARSVALMDVRRLLDADRDRIAVSVERGRTRVADLAAAAAAEIADAINMDGWRRRALTWNADHDPGAVPGMFSLPEFAVLGGAALTDFHAWGVAWTPLTGCLCTHVAEPGTWRLVVGRPQLGVISTAVPDLQFHVAIMLYELKLPARLAQTVLTAAVQEYLDNVRPLDSSDWMTLVRTARSVSRERIEDYVSAAAAAGPLVPLEGAALIER